MGNPRTPERFWNPYLGGVALGLVLLSAFVVSGQGLGASAAANRVGVAAVDTLAPSAVEANASMASLKAEGHSLLSNWWVFMALGVLLGGFLGAYTSGRLGREVLRGPRISSRARLILAVAGGVLMGIGARFALGCTSGQALTGGSLLSVGSWVFMMAVFAGGYAAAPLVRREWL